MNDIVIFKKCPLCGQTWRSRKEFLEERALELNGYLADFESIENGMFFFTHHIDGCFSTMTILAKDFIDMYTGIKYTERKKDREECPGYCLQKNQLNRCEAACEYAFVREIIQKIREYQGA